MVGVGGALLAVVDVALYGAFVDEVAVGIAVVALAEWNGEWEAVTWKEASAAAEVALAAAASYVEAWEVLDVEALIVFVVVAEDIVASADCASE